MENLFKKAAEIIKNSNHTVVFTGAGISVESGIPPFRGKNGLWSKYNPKYLDLDFFISNPKESWQVIKELFYDFFGEAKPNAAHKAIAELEKLSYVKSVITQNIDNLHQLAGSKNVIEYHGNSSFLTCINCHTKYEKELFSFNNLPLYCRKCNDLLKPDFVFFGEAIPEKANYLANEEAIKADVFIIIGTTGEVMPACSIPYISKNNGCFIIEVNPEVSNYTNSITDIFIQEKACKAMNNIFEYCRPIKN
ncbi:MAG: NAD-dependent protein deacylase Cob2 [Marinilabiliales bacterium]